MVAGGCRSARGDGRGARSCRSRSSDYDASRAVAAHRAGVLKVLHLPTAQPVVAGVLDPRNAAYVIAMLDRACDGCMNGEFAAMVTAPVQKSTLMDAGFAFTGHTEYLAARTRAALPVMMLLSGRAAGRAGDHALAAGRGAARDHRRSACATTLRIVHTDLERHFAVAAPRIAVLGLNPHAGESGHLGREEIEVIEPVIRQLRSEGLDVRGPVPADTAFTPQFLADR